LTIEVDIIAVEFWMAAHRGVEIVGRNVLRGHDFRGDGIAGRNPFVEYSTLVSGGALPSRNGAAL
jgi:hypothetical protein